MSDIDWKKLGSHLVDIGAPLLGNIIGGPPGVALASAGALLSSVLGEDTVKDPVAMLARMQAQPELLVEIRKIDRDNKESLRRLSLQQAELDYKNVQGARDREVEITKATGRLDANLYVLAWMVVCGFLATIAILAFADEAFSDNQAALLLLGALSAGFGSVLNYFFGSTKGSREKTQMLVSRMGPTQ